MSYSLAVQNGDLATEGNQLRLVWGIDKLKQDLSLWIGETYGVNRFHPTMGSIIPEYIGSVISPRTSAEIEDETMRVLDNYQKVQMQAFLQNPRIFSLTELLEAIERVSVSASYDTISVSVSVRSAARANATISVTQEV